MAAQTGKFWILVITPRDFGIFSISARDQIKLVTVDISILYLFYWSKTAVGNVVLANIYSNVWDKATITEIHVSSPRY